MLHDPARHEPCSATPWSESAARAAIDDVVRATERDFDEASASWPLHPDDRDGVANPDDAPEDHLYCGGAGIVWALARLQRDGFAVPGRDHRPFLGAMLERHRRALGVPGASRPTSYLEGQTGIHLVACALGSDHRAALASLLTEAAAEPPTCDFLEGTPGTMLTALFLRELYVHDDAERWAEVFRRDARRLRRSLAWSYLGLAHGFVGLASALIRGRSLLGADEWRDWQRLIERTVRETADVDDGAASWREYRDPGARRKLLLQVCHGAPGFVIGLGDLPGSALDDLLAFGGEAIWRAGPLAKGSGLCHGTSGNGYAFLALFRRTGDERWLARARAFAMHAIAQRDAERTVVGRPRHALWTGDQGVALYLADCVLARAGYPMVDVFALTP